MNMFEKESMDLDIWDANYGFRKLEFKFEICKNVQLWLYYMLMVNVNTQEKELLDLGLWI